MHNEGGEFHTFTRVAHFGGGCVDLPKSVGAPRPAHPGARVRRCRRARRTDLFRLAFITSGVPSGTDLSVKVDTTTAGTINYQCLIHPWMRTVVTVG